MDLSFSPDEQAFAEEVRAWLAAHLDLPPYEEWAHLDPDARMAAEMAFGRAWQAKLARDRWVGIHWPAEYGGRSASPLQVAIFNLEYARARAVQPVNRVGINNIGPTLLAHGTEEQKRRWLAPILDASELWCQLYSEPGAGSDLAALSTKAVAVDGGWLVTGQKVWTSWARFCQWGFGLFRTDPAAGKHAGISCLAVDMAAPGVDVRPLTSITGEAEFNEVFFDEVFVPEDQLIGPLHHGWSVATTTLAHERGTNFPFKEQAVHEIFLDELYGLAGRTGAWDDVGTADALADAFVALRILRLHNLRTLSRLAAGHEPGPESSWIKLHWTNMTQQLSDTAVRVAGTAGPLWGPATDNPDNGKWQRQWLWSKCASIAGGTNEIQRTIIGERILRLPR
jgi:alkylation response protein AidB-like acyl-CoA dehydrogenase